MSSWEDEESASAAATTDVELLKRAWRNEKAAPEILHFDSALVSRAREQIQLLVSIPPLGLLCTLNIPGNYANS
jgi:GINS complex subunit 4